MIDKERREEIQRKKEQTRQRMQVTLDPDKVLHTPGRKPADFYDNTSPKRVGIYVRVSTDDVRQTTSYELQKIYYEEYVNRHENWTLVDIYADEGISGTSLRHRDNFQRMIADCKAGKIDIVITKSVSRFARNVVDFISIVRDLAERRPQVGVFFESEAIFSLNEDSSMALSFQATMAEEESHTRSRSMESSLRMRLDHGLPLTPELLGYYKDENGKLTVNHEEAPTVKLIFFMYLYGYSTPQIAELLNKLGRQSYLGNVKWTSSTVIGILRNERHCGDVLTRKTYTVSYTTHKTVPNDGVKPQTTYLDHHERIVSRDDYLAVQQLLNNARFRHHAMLPELRVVESGILKGFVTINTRWSAFKEKDYYAAAQSVYIFDDTTGEIIVDQVPTEYTVNAGDFDLRDFEITRSEFFDFRIRAQVTFEDKKIKFNTPCVRKFGAKNEVELMINPITQQFAVRPATENSRSKVVISKSVNGQYVPKTVPTAAFSDTLFSLFGWDRACKYQIIGFLVESGDEFAYIFDVKNAEVCVKPYMLSPENGGCSDNNRVHHLTPIGKRVRGIPSEWTHTFGEQFYLHELTMTELARQSEKEWSLRLNGRLFETGKRLNVTSYEELSSYIKQELGDLFTPMMEVKHG
ncbi:MAG: recombinase family protein [Clostridia bacterium]|nr:recombinase family protein [Clostridia bacterium]